MAHRLTDPWFEAKFIAEISTTGSYRHMREDGQPYTLAEAQGVEFWCPCGIDARDEHGDLKYPLDLSLNKGRPHLCLVVFAGRGAPDNFGPHSRGNPTVHPRWAVAGGSGLDDLRLTPSIAVGNPECWHGHVGLNIPGEVT